MKNLLFLTALMLTFALSPLLSTAQFTKLLDFDGSNGFLPFGSLVSDGTYLYGMTWQGGVNNLGTIFKMQAEGTDYTKLLDFDFSNGAYPQGSLLYDGSYLFGMTTKGGVDDLGTIFKIRPDGTGFVKLLDFSGTANGEYPFGSLISDGTFLYGTTNTGGLNDSGTIFKIKSDGSDFTKLLDFGGANDGFAPSDDLFFYGTYIYGTTSEGGTNNLGTIFRIKPDGTNFSKLLDFNGATNGATPLGSLVTDGVFLFGTTASGGLFDKGTIFKIRPSGAEYFKLLDFEGTTGSNPWGTLLMEGQFLYGMTNGGGTNDMGIIFRIMPDGTEFTNIMNFTGEVSNGAIPYGSLISDGSSLYGMTFGGGTNGAGTVFKYSLRLMVDLYVYNAISPNGDGMNESFIIQYIDLIIDTQKNRVTIYNRWGDVVWEGIDYNNSSVVFDGTSNNGKDLPSGTYFYKIEFTGGRESKTGFLSLKR